MKLAVATLDLELERALGLGACALGLAEAGQAALLSASVQAECLVLGRLQRESSLRQRSPARFDVTVTRRLSTGTEAQLSGPALYHALALPRVDSLFADASAGTLLNRNLRALLRGYASAGVPLRYVGTEVLLLLGHPVALVGYDVTASGAVLIEVLVGLHRPVVVRSALKRGEPAALYALLGREPAPAELLSRVVSGVVERLGLASEVVSVEPGPLREAPLEAGTAAEVESVSIPLGVVEASAAGGFRVSGDLLASSAALERVERAMDAGQTPSAALGAWQGAPLHGARPADLAEVLALALGRGTP